MIYLNNIINKGELPLNNHSKVGRINVDPHKSDPIFSVVFYEAFPCSRTLGQNITNTLL